MGKFLQPKAGEDVDVSKVRLLCDQLAFRFSDSAFKEESLLYGVNISYHTSAPEGAPISFAGIITT